MSNIYLNSLIRKTDVPKLRFYSLKSRDQILNSPNPSLFIMVEHLPSVLFHDPLQTEWLVKSTQKRNIAIQSDFVIDVWSVVDLQYTAKRGTKSFEFISLKNGFKWE